jgi:hypothetical protein
MRQSLRSTLAALLVAISSGCADDRSKALPAEPTGIAATALSAYMAVSDATPPPGSRFTVAVRTKRGAAVGPVGSFTLRLTFDASKMRFVDAARSDLGMVMSNGATPGLLVAAGASATGFTNDELLFATFDAIAPDAVSSLAIDVTELNSVAFENQRGRLVLAREIVRDNRIRK